MDTLYGTPFGSFGPPWGPGHRGQQRPGRPRGSGQMRIGDAERSKVGDELGRHFSEGRLSQEEFDERLQVAMSAKTEADLWGLLDDLPRSETLSPSVQRPPARRGRSSRVLGIVLLALLAGSLIHWSLWPFHVHAHGPGALLLIVLVVCFFVRRRHRHLHRWHGDEHHHHHGPYPGPGWGGPQSGRSGSPAGWGGPQSAPTPTPYDPGDPWAA